MLTREQRDKWADALESGLWPECFPPLLFSGCINIATDPTGERDEQATRKAMRATAKLIRTLPTSDGEP